VSKEQGSIARAVEKYRVAEQKHPDQTFAPGELPYKNLACAIIEQAALDWTALDYGRIGYHYYASGRCVFRADVESFFKSKWFELLLSFALPSRTPEEVRKALRIGG